ncbi:MAG: GntR family transcriptional regulator [Chloroflexota bacterium]
MTNILPLNKYSHVPLYLQLTAQLIRKIESGELKPGDKIMSEREMAEMLGVSRITARLAIQELLKSGLVYREQGRGTFVAESRMRNVQGFTSFTEDMLGRGLRPGSRILKQEIVGADETLARTLHLEQGDEVLNLVRLRLANDRPIALQSSFMPFRLVPGLEKMDLNDRSLFEVLRKQYYIYPAWTEAVFEAAAALPEEAQYLGLKVGEPVLVVRGLTFTESFEIVESVRTAYPGKGLAIYIGRQRIGTLSERL